jgi:hypothetical protein
MGILLKCLNCDRQLIECQGVAGCLIGLGSLGLEH